MKFLVFSLLLLFFQTSFAFRYDKLVKSHVENRTVSISSVDVEEENMNRCVEYEDGNYFDGDCIKWEYKCFLKFKFPAIDFLGKPEAYEMRGGSLLDFESTKSQDCREEFLEWRSKNLDKTVTYGYEEQLYSINYQPGLGADCFQIPLLKIKTTLNLIPTNWFYEESSGLLGLDPQYKVSCDKLDRE